MPTMLVMARDIRLDHSIVAVSDWETSNRFYRDILWAQLVPHGEPPRVAYRLGDTQLNVHGPGVDLSSNVAKLPVQPGNSDLCFVWLDQSKARPLTWYAMASMWRPDR
jgi:catechol 2,3-dioxygenase-like lactoylglutathione lyase family enzyme